MKVNQKLEHLNLKGSHKLTTPPKEETNNMNYDHLIGHLPIYKAALHDDWESVKHIFNNDETTMITEITYWSETPLHIAVATNRSHRFVDQLLGRIVTIGLEHLRTPDWLGYNPLHYAAMVGNTRAARLLVEMDPDMTQIANPDGNTPLKLAALYGHKETLWYLLNVTKDLNGEDGINPYTGVAGADLISLAITASFYDVALYLVENYPNLVTEKDGNGQTALQTLAAKPNAFPSGSQLGFWQNLIYSWILEKEIDLPTKRGDTTIMGARDKAVAATSFFMGYFKRGFWRVLQCLEIKKIHDLKVTHMQTEQLVKRMCLTIIKKVDHSIAWDVLGTAVSTAVKYGIHELIEECIRTYPGLIWHRVEGVKLFSAAIKHRQEKVYNLVYQMAGYKALASIETLGDNPLHMAGKLAPSHRLKSTVTGAALQMQRELLWFKEVEKLVQPSYKEALNQEQKTPRMVFTDEHKDLVKEGQEWINGTARSSTVVAALIVTVAFSAAFTVPVGNDDRGMPLFLKDGNFITFAISDAIALFSSTTSVLTFLAVLTSRYSEEDFLYALPKRLIIGLFSLFLSIAATMIAFSAKLALVLRSEIAWITIPLTSIAAVPVTLFVLLQFPLLIELVCSTYGPSIFHKQNKMLLH